MAVKIRLRRTGGKKNPHYRLVVTDARERRDGRSLAVLGHYHPAESPAAITLDEAAILDWLRQGAQPSETVRSLLSQHGVWQKHRAGAAAPAGETA